LSLVEIDKIYTCEGYTKGRKCIKLLLDSLPPAAALPPRNLNSVTPYQVFIYKHYSTYEYESLQQSVVYLCYH